jgi:acetyl-CoA C-acetyltransferase
LDDPSAADEPLKLMVRAAQAAGRDAGSLHLLRAVERVYVPQGRWGYQDPGRGVAQQIGAVGATTVLAKIGVLQEALIADACLRIAAGEVRAALIVGGEAGYRLLRSRILDAPLAETELESTPDVTWAPAGRLMSKQELAGGLGRDALPYYAIMESAFRHKHGWSVDDHRDRLATLYSAFSRVAADNPHAWDRRGHPAEEIRQPSTGNSMLAFPYTKLHASSWSVDQASALLLCAADWAEHAGVPRQNFVYPLASAVSEHMVHLSARDDLAGCPGAQAVAAAALDRCALCINDIELLDLYSCFPVAVELFAEALAVPPGRSLTITGGMPFAGGPLNNYVIHAVAQLAEQIRSGRGTRGLVTSVSGVMTKQAVGMWAAAPPPRGYTAIDVSAEVSKRSPTRHVTSGYAGPGTIAGFTVLYERATPTRAVAVIDTEQGERTIAACSDRHTIDSMGSAELCGHRVVVDGCGRFRLAADARRCTDANH